MSRARYAASVQDFYESTRPGVRDSLVRRLARQWSPDRRKDIGEVGAWTASLPALAEVLMKAGLAKLWIILEYQPYQAGNSRADAIVTGFGPDGRPTYLVVELKQWQRAVWDAQNERVTGTGARYERDHGLRHPWDQAHDYGQFIRNFTQGMHENDPIVIAAAAYLHNATETSVETLRTAGQAQAAGTFSGDATGRERFIELLGSLFDAEQDGSLAWDWLDQAAYEQGPSLLDAAARIFTDRDHYPLTDEQHAVFGEIQNAVSRAMDPAADRSQAVIVVQGGPGTGKTWIALHLLGANAHAHRQVSYATNSGSLRNALQKSAGFRTHFGAGQADKLITSARTYWDSERWANPLDLLIIDEAHRLEEWTVRRAQRNPRALQEQLEEGNITQLFELKKSAKVLVLFIDEDQASTYRDFVTIEHARQIADRTGASFRYLELTEQHRSGGSQAYEAWVDALLGGTPAVWHDEDNFRVSVADSPEELEKRVFDGADEGTARLVAGFCWEWQKWPVGAVELRDVPFDIEINGWKKHWNLRKSIEGYPQDTLWAHKPSGAAQVGSIFTAQGFEFDRVGVIMGPDLVWNVDSGRMAVHMDASRYAKLVQAHRRNPAEEARIRNQYRVLFTRAMRNVVLHSTDPTTLALLKTIVNPESPGSSDDVKG